MLITSLDTKFTIKTELQGDEKISTWKIVFTCRKSLLIFSGLHDCAHFEQLSLLKEVTCTFFK